MTKLPQKPEEIFQAFEPYFAGKVSEEDQVLLACEVETILTGQDDAGRLLEIRCETSKTTDTLRNLLPIMWEGTRIVVSLREAEAIPAEKKAVLEEQVGV
jgi:hypothetical protein